MSNAVKVKISLINEPNEIYVKFLEGELSTNNDKLRRQTNDYQDQLAGLAKTSKIEKNPIVGEVRRKGICLLSIIFMQLIFHRFTDAMSTLGRNGFVER